MTITMTKAASSKVLQLITEEEDPNLKLRVYIVGGGCSGFQYGFAFDAKVNDDDCVIETMEENKPNKVSVALVVDAMSLNYLQGAQIDYIEELQGAHFVVKNPNAKTTCGCGSSFSV